MQGNAEAKLLDMKKIFLVGILSILFVGISFAQTRIGITAGLNVSNIIVSGSEAKVSYDYKAGFQAGVVADFGITNNFSVIPELLFSQRGCKFKDLDMSMTLNYLQLPVNLAYKFDVGYGSKLFIFAGPYIGYGISASDDFKFGSGDNEIKPFDFGVTGGIGYQFERVFFKLQCNPGLLNMNNNSSVTTKNMNVAVTAGYFFN